MTNAFVFALALPGMSGLQASDTTKNVRPSWVLENDTTKPGQTSNAWVLLPRTTEGKATVVTLESPSDVALWFRDGRETCAEAERKKLKSLTLAAGSDTVLRTCVRPGRKQSLSLLAIVRDSGGRYVETRLASARLTAISSWQPGPIFYALLTATLGVLAGLASHFGQGYFDSRRKSREQREDLSVRLASEIAPEIAGNRRDLESYLSGQKPFHALSNRVFNIILGDKGALAFLKEDERQQAYSARLQALYDKVRVYNKAVFHKKQPEIMAAANALKGEFAEWETDPKDDVSSQASAAEGSTI